MLVAKACAVRSGGKAGEMTSLHLLDRRQVVSAENVGGSVQSSMVQGSLLRALLFIVLVNDLGEVAENPCSSRTTSRLCSE